MLDNLLGNALKYSPDGSPVRVAVKTRNGTLVTTVTDRGPGVAARPGDGRPTRPERERSLSSPR